MPIDPQAQAAEDAWDALGIPPLETLPPAEARARFEALPALEGPPVGRVEDRMAQGSDGDVPVRVYWPEGEGPRPAFMYFHGGGWVVGSVANQDGTVRHLVRESGCVGISVEYRMAPEHRFPTAAEDCYTATKWAADNAAALGIRPGRFAVLGVSSGGNLAAAVALMARDRAAPDLALQTLVVPVLARDFTTPSYLEKADGPGLTRRRMQWYWDLYLRDEADAANPYAAPAAAESLAGLPPALVLTAEYDVLRDEGRQYAKRLQEAGVPTTHLDYAGMTHLFFNRWNAIDRARETIAFVGGELAQRLA